MDPGRLGGFFDARASGTLDPSGLVKGWSVDVASELLVEAGSNSHCINAGGDIRMRGEPGPGRPWRIGISHPLFPGRLTIIVTGHDLAVATSGTAERGLHITDPFTRGPAAGLAGVTVVGPDLTLADSYATAAMAMGLDAPAWLARLPDHEAYLIDASGHAWWTAGFPRHAPALATMPQPRLASDGL
jgi:thiamine biosynthesis lipoprotein